MAKLMAPLMSTEARGRVSGLVYNTWRGISYAKAASSPAQPQTQRQLQIRAWSTQLVRGWAALSTVEKTGWNDYANAHPAIDWTGNAKRLTGLNWFTRCNVRLLDLGETPSDTAPTVSAPDPVADVVITPGAGQISVAFTAMAGTNLQIDCWDSGLRSAGTVPSLIHAKHLKYGPGETSPLVCSGLVPGLHTFWFRAVSEDTGLASTFVSADATVT
jgi:hypothetical protein